MNYTRKILSLSDDGPSQGRDMMHGDGDWHWGFGFGHWGLGLLFWVVVILVIAALLKYLFGGRG